MPAPEPLAQQPDVNAIEQGVLRFWREERIFQKSVEQREGNEPFVIYDGPPTANAKPPLHTMLPMSFKDLVGRYQAMRGKYVRRQVGWDTHGLPVEVQVERALGLSGKRDILNVVPGDERASIAKFNKICRDSVWEFKQDWDKFVARNGYWTDTQHPYITYDSAYIENVWGVLKQVWDKDLVYRGYKVMPYCPRCGTGLSALELADGYQDVRDTSVFVVFPLEGSERSLLAWTTTPWTLPGNTALAINPKLEYVAVRQEGREYVLAKSRMEILRGEYELLETVDPTGLIGAEYRPPFPGALTGEGNKHLVLAADFVTDEDGTGVVHIAPMYGEDDFQLGQQNGLAMQHTVGLDGRFLPEVPVVGGTYIRDALGAILTYLTERQTLYAKQSFTHSYPHCWRCKTALLYYAKDSWFVAMSRLRERLVAANSHVNWIPEHIKDGRFGDFIRQARDWAISRERFWGTPLPIWHSETGDRYLCVGSFEELRGLAEDPSLVGDGFDPHRPQVDDIVIVKDGVRYHREPLVMDVWFDSGSMPYASGRVAAGEFPADYIAEAVDQTRGWFYSLMALGTILEGQSPYRAVVCMGHLVDDQGKKMSKSIGNVFDPFQMMEQVGADALRWFFYTVNSPGETKSFSIADVQTGFRKTLLLAYNMVKYWQTYADPDQDADGFSETQHPLDVWALARERQTVADVTQLLDSFDFMRAGRALEAYINDLSTWYLRRSRKRDDPAFYPVIANRLRTLVTLLAPFTPFMSEYLYGYLRRSDDPISVHLADWPAPDSADQDALERMAGVRQAVELGLGVRAQIGLKVRQPLAMAVISGLPEVSSQLLGILADELNVLEVRQGSVPEGWAAKSDGGLSVGLDAELTDQLRAAGQARELLRQLQSLRKGAGMQPGEPARLQAGPYARALLEPVFAEFPSVLAESGIIDTDWSAEGSEPLQVGGETAYVRLSRHVEPV